MKRFLGRVIVLAAFVSCTFCLLTSMMWVRSCLTADDFHLSLRGEGAASVIDSHSVVSARGTIQYTRWWSLHLEPTLHLWRQGEVSRTWESGPQRMLLPLYNEHPPDDMGFPSYTWMGFHWSDTQDTSLGPDGLPAIDRSITVCVPYAALVALLAIIPSILAFRWARLRHRRLRSPMACLTCGYDLRASPERCPECGAANRAQYDVTRCDASPVMSSSPSP